jgi:hypothetical protein
MGRLHGCGRHRSRVVAKGLVIDAGPATPGCLTTKGASDNSETASPTGTGDLRSRCGIRRGSQRARAVPLDQARSQRCRRCAEGLTGREWTCWNRRSRTHDTGASDRLPTVPARPCGTTSGKLQLDGSKATKTPSVAPASAGLPDPAALRVGQRKEAALRSKAALRATRGREMGIQF